MRIEGWAFTVNEEFISKERYARYKELDPKDFEVINIQHGYTQKVYTVLVKNDKLTELDILLYCDSGNTCFGGNVEKLKTNKEGHHFYKVTVFID